MEAFWNKPWVTPPQKRRLIRKYSTGLVLLVAGFVVIGVAFFTQPTPGNRSEVITAVAELLVALLLIIFGAMSALEAMSYANGLRDSAMSDTS
jgi:hypothetical protein